MDYKEIRKASICRADMVLLVIAGFVALGLLITYFETRLPASSPYKKCQTGIFIDQKCKLKVSVDRLMRGGY
uniref:hypothetical protein n=1 Tax=Altererythrobacter segetis TaxID=1104773 RepID=UPI00140A26F0|nr:hypothetical protein [Altererythrobacter segetis]